MDLIKKNLFSSLCVNNINNIKPRLCASIPADVRSMLLACWCCSGGSRDDHGACAAGVAAVVCPCDDGKSDDVTSVGSGTSVSAANPHLFYLVGRAFAYL